MSSLLKALVESSGEFEFEDGQDVELKGLSGSHEVFGAARPGIQVPESPQVINNSFSIHDSFPRLFTVPRYGCTAVNNHWPGRT